MAPGGTVYLKLEKLRGLTEKSPSVIVSVCDMVMNSRSSWAAVLLLRTTQAIAGSISTAIQIAVFGLERLRTSNRLGCSQQQDRKSTRLNSSHLGISYAVFCL